MAGDGASLICSSSYGYSLRKPHRLRKLEISIAIAIATNSQMRRKTFDVTTNKSCSANDQRGCNYRNCERASAVELVGQKADIYASSSNDKLNAYYELLCACEL